MPGTPALSSPAINATTQANCDDHNLTIISLSVAAGVSTAVVLCYAGYRVTVKVYEYITQTLLRRLTDGKPDISGFPDSNLVEGK